MWEKFLLEYFETRWGLPHLPNIWLRTFSAGLSVSFCSRGAWLKLHRKNWTHVTKWSTGTIACMCTRWLCGMLLHATLEKRPERRTTDPKWSPWEGTHEEHYLFLVDSPGYDERARELSKEAGPRSIQKASNLGQAAKSRGELVGIEEPTRAKVGEIATGVLRERDEPPSSAQLPMATNFTRTERQFLFTWCLAGVALEDLISCDKLKFGDKSLHVFWMMMQYVASCCT